ncbi:condensation domain-containing protein, partial [Mycolicibacterium tusciae]
MQHGDRALPLTRGQLDIWLAHETGRFGTEWQLGLFARIAGRVERGPLEWAIRRVVREAEPARVTFFQENGQVLQSPIDDPEVEIAFHDLRDSHDPAKAAFEIASTIQRTPMSLTGPLFKFAFFQTAPSEFYLFTCCHHIITDGSGVALVGNRIAAVYTAIVSGAPIPPPFFGSLQDLIKSELEYEASSDYVEDQAYWTENLPSEVGPHCRMPQSTGERDPYLPSAPVRLDPAVLRRVDALSKAWNIPRSSIITAASALLVRGWCDEGTESSEVVLDFPVSRRVLPESKTVPGMVAGIVPLVLKVEPGSAISEFCEHVDTRIREAVQHQRFPVQALERKTNDHGMGRPADRVSVNFIPSIFTLDFGGAAASASYTSSGVVGGFGFFFSGVGNELFLCTAGPGQPFSDFNVADWARRLERVLVGLVADPSRRLSSVDVVDGG